MKNIIIKIKSFFKREDKGIVVLLTILLNHLTTQGSIAAGLCNEVGVLHNLKMINSNQYLILINYIKKNKPVFNHDSNPGNYWGWKMGLYEPRINWLKEQISLNDVF